MTKCVYCGRRVNTKREPPACGLHRGLLAVDPYYSAARQLRHDA